MNSEGFRNGDDDHITLGEVHRIRVMKRLAFVIVVLVLGALLLLFLKGAT